MIVGRDDELRRLREFADQIRVQGESLLLSGDAGVGKTALLDAAAQYARAQGYRVVHADGVEFEAGVSFAALHLVLQPLLGDLEKLTEWHRDALMTALGLREGPRLDQLVLTNATLALLAAAADSAPLLLIIDDMPWIDRASAAVLGFVARRLGTDISLAAIRQPKRCHVVSLERWIRVPGGHGGTVPGPGPRDERPALSGSAHPGGPASRPPPRSDRPVA